MIQGAFRDGHPRVVITVHGDTGAQAIEFTVDTGFEGDLALPSRIVSTLGVQPTGVRRRGLANGAVISCRFFQVSIDSMAGTRGAEVLLLEGMPLLGTALLDEQFLHIEVTEGGEVLIEPL